jgi:translation initiation factor 2 beta subunit (eIF-2beta)/eIF-5
MDTPKNMIKRRIRNSMPQNSMSMVQNRSMDRPYSRNLEVPYTSKKTSGRNSRAQFGN